MSESDFLLRIVNNTRRAAVKIAKEAGMLVDKPFPSVTDLSRMPKKKREKYQQAKTLGDIANNVEEVGHSKS